MKKMIKATGLLCAAALTAAMGFSSLAVTDNSADSLGTAGAGLVQFDGTVVSVEEDRFVMDRETGVQTGELVVNVSEDTLLLDGVNGYPISMDHLEEGESVRVYVAPGDDDEPSADLQRRCSPGGCSGGRRFPDLYAGEGRCMGAGAGGWNAAGSMS